MLLQDTEAQAMMSTLMLLPWPTVYTVWLNYNGSSSLHLAMDMDQAVCIMPWLNCIAQVLCTSVIDMAQAVCTMPLGFKLSVL